MKKSLFIILCFFHFLPCNAQQSIHADSIFVYPANPTSNDFITVRVVGDLAMTGVSITRVVTTIEPDSVILDFYTSMCDGFNVLVPFDTLINIGQLQQGNYTIEYRGILDTNTTDSLCYIVSTPIYCDSLFTSVTILPTSVEFLTSNDEIKIFPNPVNASFQIELNSEINIEKIKIYSSVGEEIYNVKYISRENDVEVKALPSGIYWIEIITREKIFRSKFLKR